MLLGWFWNAGAGGADASGVLDACPGSISAVWGRVFGLVGGGVFA